MEPTRRRTGPLTAITTAVEGVYTWLRRFLGLFYSVLMRDSLSSLRNELIHLNSVAVESASYVAAELRSIEERMTTLEEELVALRKLLEQRQTVSGRSPD